MPVMGAYALRHTSATLALANGAKVKAVSERLGHSDIAITLNRYGHVIPQMQDEELSILENALYEEDPVDSG